MIVGAVTEAFNQWVQNDYDFNKINKDKVVYMSLTTGITAWSGAKLPTTNKSIQTIMGYIIMNNAIYDKKPEIPDRVIHEK